MLYEVITGSQTLVRDIVTGAFFLVDDAFRLGEYIEVGNTKGRIVITSYSIHYTKLYDLSGSSRSLPSSGSAEISAPIFLMIFFTSARSVS